MNIRGMIENSNRLLSGAQKEVVRLSGQVDINSGNLSFSVYRQGNLLESYSFEYGDLWINDTPFLDVLSTIFDDDFERPVILDDILWDDLKAFFDKSFNVPLSWVINPDNAIWLLLAFLLGEKIPIEKEYCYLLKYYYSYPSIPIGYLTRFASMEGVDCLKRIYTSKPDEDYFNMMLELMSKSLPAGHLFSAYELFFLEIMVEKCDSDSLSKRVEAVRNMIEKTNKDEYMDMFF